MEVEEPEEMELEEQIPEEDAEDEEGDPGVGRKTAYGAVVSGSADVLTTFKLDLDFPDEGSDAALLLRGV